MNAIVDLRRFAAPSLQANLKQWLTTEDALIRQHYPLGGGLACLDVLPGRTLSAIYSRAGKLGLAAANLQRGVQHRTPYEATELIDADIRRVYLSTPTRGIVNELARRVMRPKWWVSRRARSMGLVVPRFKELPWSAAELKIVEDNAHKVTAVIKRILRQRGFKRTETAIAIRVKREGFDRHDPNHYTANQLALLLGIDGKTVTRWIELEGLPATRRGTKRTESQGGDQWWIERSALRAWIGKHAQLIDLRKVERYWFIDLAFGPVLRMDAE